MIKTVLVPLDGSPGGHALNAALGIARTFDAHLNVLHVHVDERELVLSVASSDPSGAAVGSGIIEDMMRDADEREAAAKGAFDAFCTREHLRVTAQPRGDGASAEWVREAGLDHRRVAEHGRVADLTVLGRGNGSMPAALLNAALLQTGRPLLLVPPGSAPLPAGTAAIAWKDTPEAAHAVAAAMPFLRRAHRIVVLCVDEGGRDGSAARLVHALGWHGMDAAVEHLARGAEPPAETLLNAAVRLGATLLVMGGYGHSRLREFVFGGFTERILHEAGLPVLMAH